MVVNSFPMGNLLYFPSHSESGLTYTTTRMCILCIAKQYHYPLLRTVH